MGAVASIRFAFNSHHLEDKDILVIGGYVQVSMFIKLICINVHFFTSSIWNAVDLYHKQCIYYFIQRHTILSGLSVATLPKPFL